MSGGSRRFAACRRTAAWLGSLLAISLPTLLGAGTARANGAFPSSGQILIDPSDPARVGVRTTYGLVETADDGASFRWTCETALGYSDPGHPQFGVTADGIVFGGLLDGMIRGRLGACEWGRVASLEGLRVVDVSWSATTGRAIAAVVPAIDARGEIWASDDGAATWEKLGATLPVKFSPLTLDAAPSDGDRLYVSGLVEGDPVRGAVARSVDGGASWSVSYVDDADASKAPFIGAIDPNDPDVVWVRLDAAPGELFVSRDGGETWELALIIDGFLRAFALSPDGSEVIAGGDADGLARADAALLDWAPMSPVAARCARWHGDVIDVCGTEAIDHFTMGRSSDDGATFQPFYRQTCLLGPEACESTTPVGECAAAWPTVQGQIGAVGCGEGGGSTTDASAATGSESSGGPASASGSSAATSASVDSSAGAGGAPAGDGDGDDGCSCRSTPGRETASIASVIAALCLAGVARARASGRHPPSRQRERRR